jgi:hypothetical protein
MLDQLKQWAEKFETSEWEQDGGEISFLIVGRENDYKIVATEGWLQAFLIGKDGEGCNDLPDGDFGVETWCEILTAILEFEMYPERWE